MRIVVIAALAAALSGCAGDVAAYDEALVMGDPDPDDPAVVAITSGDALCTGTLIAPDVVLTAAHCAVVVPDYVVFGASTASGGTRVDVVDAVSDPHFDRLTFDHDVAVLLLASVATVEPVPMLEPGAVLAAGTSVRIAGFGAVDGTGAGAGQKRTGTASISTVAEASFELTPDPSQPCAGDSGGPAFVTVGGRELLAGVHSGGNPACTAGSREMRVDAHRDFIDPYLHRGGCSVGGGSSSPLVAVVLALLLRRSARRQIKIV